MLVVGAYREADLTEQHLLAQAIAHMRESGAEAVTEIRLTPLSSNAVGHGSRTRSRHRPNTSRPSPRSSPNEPGTLPCSSRASSSRFAIVAFSDIRPTRTAGSGQSTRCVPRHTRTTLRR
jgi:hypothetical protein